MKTLFLEQSYKDVNKYLIDNINSQKYEAWDYIVITASNDIQAKNYELQIENKLANKFLDSRTKYVVVADLDNQRIGSGGATLNTLAVLKQKYNVDFNKSRILLIHSGGDSKRIPQYSACGKLFSPVPRELSSNTAATLFDELLAATALFPGRMKSGVLVLSGDAMLLFNPLQVEFKENVISAVSIKKSVEMGKNHGVFLLDGKGCVLEFLHKKTVQELTIKGAVDDNGQINIDTGVIYFAGAIANKMLSLISVDGKISDALTAKYINSQIRLSFYGDFLCPFAQNSSLQGYIDEPSEGEYCEQLLECRRAIWDKFNGVKMNVISVAPADFLHFGTTYEMLNLVSCEVENYKFLGWKKNVVSNVKDKNYASYNSVINNSQIGKNSYIENSKLESCKVGYSSIISNIAMSNVVVPDNVVLSGLLLNSGKYVVRIYGVKDNPKKLLIDECIFNLSLQGFATRNDIDLKSISTDGTLWTAEIYPTADTMDMAVEYALRTYDMLVGGDSTFVEFWKTHERKSLENSYNEVNIDHIVKWNDDIKAAIIESKIIQALENRVDFDELIEEIGQNLIKESLVKLLGRIETFEYKLRSRLYLLASVIETDNKLISKYRDKVFEVVKRQAMQSFTTKVRGRLIKAADVKMPARVNFAGGWTDTPPYCVENGGTVLNAAILLSGQCPITAHVQPTKDRKFVLASTDMKVAKDIVSKTELMNCDNPFDRVVLQKSAIVAMGIVGDGDDEDLGNVFDELGGGLILTTNVENIPKGSGLGSSSILASACIKALYLAMGIPCTMQEMSAKVMDIEQLMSTGGGWQDQIGAAVGGVKIITSTSGVQELTVRQLELSDLTKDELNSRFAIIYTGQRRLARNLLRDIVTSYLSGKESTLSALDSMENIAMVMTRKLERGDIDAFAELMNEHWELSKQLDPGTTNTCIDYIFDSCKDLIKGKMICGAGGGGFLQVILNKGITKQELQQRLEQVFDSTNIAVYDCEVVY